MNNTEYGLSAGVWTDKGSKRASGWRRGLKAGVVWANTYNKFDPSSPFGGYKESGFGREGGRQGPARLPRGGLEVMAAWSNPADVRGQRRGAENVRIGVRKAYKMFIGGAFVRSEIWAATRRWTK